MKTKSFIPITSNEDPSVLIKDISLNIANRTSFPEIPPLFHKYSHHYNVVCSRHVRAGIPDINYLKVTFINGLAVLCFKTFNWYNFDF